MTLAHHTWCDKINGAWWCHPSCAALSENAANPPTDSKGLTMTDPLLYEAGVTPAGEQLDVYDCLALAAQDALADTAAAADAAMREVLAQDEGYVSLGEYLNEQDESSEDYYDDDPFVEQAHYADDDDFTFLPDYLRG